MDKKYVSIILTVALIICLFPFSAFADNPVPTVTIGEIILSESHTSDVALSGVEYHADSNVLEISGDVPNISYNSFGCDKPFTLLVSGDITMGAICSDDSLIITSAAVGSKLNIKANPDERGILFTKGADLEIDESVETTITAGDYSDAIFGEEWLNIYLDGTNLSLNSENGNAIAVNRNLYVSLTSAAHLYIESYYGISQERDNGAYVDISLSDNSQLKINSRGAGIYSWGKVEICASDSSVLDINAEYYSAIGSDGNLIINASGNAKVSTKSSDSNALYSYLNTEIEVDDNAELSIFSVWDNGMYVDGDLMLDLYKNASLDVSSDNSNGINVYGNAFINMSSSSALSVSATDKGITVTQYLELQMSDEAKLDINAAKIAFEGSDRSEIKIEGNAVMTAAAYTGFHLNDEDSFVKVSGGALCVHADEYAMQGGNLEAVSGSSVEMVGLTQAFKGLYSLKEDGEFVDDFSEKYEVVGASYFYPSRSTVSVVDKISDTEYKITDDINVPEIIEITSSGAVSIDVNGKTVKNLVIVYAAEDINVTLSNAGNAHITVRIKDEYIAAYYNSESALLKGANAESCALDVPGYALYPKTSDTDFSIIKTIDAPFAVAEEVASGKVSKFKFFTDIRDAIAAVSDAAIHNRLYVLNYHNNAEQTGKYRVFLPEELSATAISIEGLTLDTVTRVTNGLYSTFYTVNSQGRAVEQYSNGPVSVGSPSDFGMAYLHGNFTGNYNYKSIAVFNTGNETTGLELAGGVNLETKVIYIPYGEALPAFELHNRQGYELMGYYTAENGGNMVLASDGSIVVGSNYFDGDGRFDYSGFLRLYAHWKWVGSEAADEGAKVYIGDTVFDAAHRTDEGLPGVIYSPETNTLELNNFTATDNGKLYELRYETDNGTILNISLRNTSRFRTLKTNGSFNVTGGGILNILSDDEESKALLMSGEGGKLSVERGTQLKIKSAEDAIYSEHDLNVIIAGRLTIDAAEDAIESRGDLNLSLLDDANVHMKTDDDGIVSKGLFDLSMLGNAKMIIECDDYAIWQDNYSNNLNIKLSGSAELELVGEDGADASGIVNLDVCGDAQLIIAADAYGFYFEKALYMNFTDNAYVKISGPEVVGIDAWGRYELLMSDNAKFDIQSKNLGIEAHNFTLIDLTSNAAFSLNVDNAAMLLQDSRLTVQNNASLNVNALYGSGINTGGKLFFNAKDESSINIYSAEGGLSFADESDIIFEDNAEVNIEAEYGIFAPYSNSGVSVFGGTTNIKAVYGVSAGWLICGGSGKINVTGYTAALHMLSNLVEDAELKTNTYNYPGSVYSYPHIDSTAEIVSAGGIKYTSFDEAYSKLSSGEAIEILEDLSDIATLRITSDKAFTIDAKNKSVSNLMLSYVCDNICVDFDNSENLSCTVCLSEEEALRDHYLSGSTVLIFGLNANQTSLNVAGYTLYEEEGGSGLVIIPTLDAPFAVAESVDSGKVTEFKFYRYLEDAIAAASDAAIKNKVYVLNYENPTSYIYAPSVDYTEQTTPDAISLGGIILTTVTRFTNGISSAFYVGRAGESVLQYTNGNNCTPPDHGNMTATLIGNFDCGPANADNIIIATGNEVYSLIIKGITGSTDDITFYMADGAMVPNFPLAQKEGYKLLGYYVKSDFEGDILVLDGKGLAISSAGFHTIAPEGEQYVRVFDDDGRWNCPQGLTLYPQFEELPNPGEDEPEDVPVDVPSGGGGRATVSKSTDVAVYASMAAAKFTDVNVSEYYAAPVGWAIENRVTLGVSESLFGPNESCSRAQVVEFLYRIAGEPEIEIASAFSDVKDDAYYAKAVSWAVDNEITFGLGDGTFDPDGTVNREQFVTFLYRTAKLLGDKMKLGSISTAPFTDKEQISSFAADAFEWAVSRGICNGTSTTTLSPAEDCLRAQVVSFLYRYFVK